MGGGEKGKGLSGNKEKGGANGAVDRGNHCSSVLKELTLKHGNGTQK